MAIDIYYLKNKKGNLGTKLIIIYMGVGGGVGGAGGREGRGGVIIG